MLRMLLVTASYLAASWASAHTFCVTDAGGLQTALDQAADPLVYGNEDNAVNIASGTYNTGAGAFHFSSTQTGALAITGGWDSTCATQTEDASLTIIDGHHATQGMNLAATQVPIGVANLTIANGEGTSDGGGLYVSATFTGTEVHDQLANLILRDNHTTAQGGGFWFATAGQIRAYVLTCLVTGNSADLGFGAGYVSRNSSRGAIIDNNTVTQNTTVADGGSGGIGYANDAAVFGFGDIENNILWNNTASSFFCAAGCTAVTFDANDYDVLAGTPVTLDVLRPDISSDPKFRDAASGDFRLGSGSPALAYSSFRIAGYDLDGNTIDGTAPTDLGAYEETLLRAGFDE